MASKYLTVSLDFSGPLLTGQGQRIVDDFRADAMKAVGQEAISQLHFRMDQSFKNPTPYYETQVVMNTQVDSTQIHDRDIVYGPWLEGISSRNRTTRFKGYKIWRRTYQDVKGRVPSLVAPHWSRALGRLRG